MIAACSSCRGNGFVEARPGPSCGCREAMCVHFSPFGEGRNEEPRAGLYSKFWVTRTDRSSQAGGKHEHCDYFVLDWKHDKFAAAAALAYAAACEAEYPELAADLRTRAAEATPAPTPAGKRP